MTKLCETCGRLLSQAHQGEVCRTCEGTKTHNLKFMGFYCPECDTILKIYHTQLLDYVEPTHSDEWPFVKIGLMYHCPHCGCDYTSEFTYDWGDIGQTELKRHYWG